MVNGASRPTMAPPSRREPSQPGAAQRPEMEYFDMAAAM